MKGGLGTASRQVGAATVGALVAVNAFGDVRDPATGALLAGARDAPAGHRLVDTARQLREGRITPGFRQTHTTIGVVATDASRSTPPRRAAWPRSRTSGSPRRCRRRI